MPHACKISEVIELQQHQYDDFVLCSLWYEDDVRNMDSSATDEEARAALRHAAVTYRVNPLSPTHFFYSTEIISMRILPVSPKRAAQLHPSPVEIWQALLTYLIDRHYGLTLNDTPFGNDDVIQEHIDAGISLCDAVNFIVEKYDLVRTDRP